MDKVIIIFVVISIVNGHVFIFVKRDPDKIVQHIKEIFDSDENRHALENKKGKNYSTGTAQNYNYLVSDEIDKEYFNAFKLNNNQKNMKSDMKPPNSKNKPSTVDGDMKFGAFEGNNKKEFPNSQKKKSFIHNKRETPKSYTDYSYDIFGMRTENDFSKTNNKQDILKYIKEQNNNKPNNFRIDKMQPNLEIIENHNTLKENIENDSSRRDKYRNAKYEAFKIIKKQVASATRNRMKPTGSWEITSTKFVSSTLLPEIKKQEKLSDLMKSSLFMKVIKKIMYPEAIRSILYHGLRRQMDEVSKTDKEISSTNVDNEEIGSDKMDDDAEDDDLEDDEESNGEFCKDNFNPLCSLKKVLTRTKKEYKSKNDEETSTYSMDLQQNNSDNDLDELIKHIRRTSS